MKPIYDAWLIQIEITNACIHRCAHCTRSVRNIRKPVFADLDFIEKALKSLDGWEKGVGCMGGEPTIHPQFNEICKLWSKYVPRKCSGLWTAGGKKYEEHKELIDKTFGIINFNDHYYPSFHQPILIGSDEIIKDEHLRKKIVNNCWLQRTWSPNITPKGGFFCEVASTIDLLFDGPGGYSLEPGWWNKKNKDIADQIDRYCSRCSVAIPLETHPDTLEYEIVSKKNAELLLKTQSPQALAGKLKIVDMNYTKADYIRISKSKNYREPQKYADTGTKHFWYRNSLLLQQKINSIPYKIKSILADWSIRYF